MISEVSCTIGFTSKKPLENRLNTKPTKCGYNELHKYHYWEKQLRKKTYIVEDVLGEARTLLSNDEKYPDVTASTDIELSVFLGIPAGDSWPALTLERDSMRFLADHAVLLNIELYSESYLASLSYSTGNGPHQSMSLSDGHKNSSLPTQ